MFARPTETITARSNLMKRPHTAPRGFSLVELLVVILIIVVLAALGFTLSVRMKKSANQAITTANLRQIGVALISFTSDKGRFPSLNGDPVWDRAIISNLGYSEIIAGTGTIKISAYPALDATAKLFITPEDEEKHDPSFYARSFAIVPWTTNWSNGTAFRGWKNRPYNTGVPYSALDSPEKNAMVVQWHRGGNGTANQLGHGNHAYHDIGGPAKTLGSMQQILFADGHVDKIRANMSNSEFVAKYWPGTIGSTN